MSTNHSGCLAYKLSNYVVSKTLQPNISLFIPGELKTKVYNFCKNRHQQSYKG